MQKLKKKQSDPKKVSTLVLVRDDSRVLLGMKKRGFGAGRFNGFGGKLMPGETIEAAAHRELLEEAGITVKKLEKFGIVHFEFQGDPTILEVHFFKAREFSGVPTEGEEMKPQWFPIDAIPFHSMWPDDPHWFPLFLSDKKFQGRFLFGENDKILRKWLEEITDLPRVEIEDSLP